MEDIVVEELKAKAYHICFAGIIMLIASMVLWWFGVKEHSGLYLFIGIVATAFFGIGTIVSLNRAVKSKPLLTIKWDGIIDSSSASAVGFIPFHEIDHIDIVNIYGQRVIGVTLRDVTGFIKKLSKGKQRATKINMKMNFPPITIRLDTAKDMLIEDIYSMIQKRLQDYKRLYY